MKAVAIVVAYDSGAALTRCLDALRTDGVEVVVVNNGGAGPEIEDARRREGVDVVDAGENRGFGAGCNRGAAATDAEALVFLNPDTVAQPGAVAALARRLEDPGVGVAQPRLRLLAQPELLNSSGNVVHVSGLAWPGGYGEPADALTELREIPSASGAALAIRAELFRELGGFTEELFLYQEDLELCWRVRLRGLRIVLEPGADVLHDYVLERADRRKEYYLERNRLVFVLTSAAPARARTRPGRARSGAPRPAPGVVAREGTRVGLARRERVVARRPPARAPGRPPRLGPGARALPDTRPRPADAHAARRRRGAERRRLRLVARRPRPPLTLPSAG